LDIVGERGCDKEEEEGEVYKEGRDRQTLGYVGSLIKEECTRWNGGSFTVAFEGRRLCEVEW